MRRFLLGPVFLVFFIGSAYAALSFPALTGRVVDDATILSTSTKQSLEQELANYEQSTTNQVVIVTLRSLQGTTIEDYGYQLGRTWGIGQKGKDNGVLLIVAPKERKVRIEVGYGLEGTLTDALSSQIIQGTILPDFRSGNMEQGIIDGMHAILSTLNGQPIDITSQMDFDPQHGGRSPGIYQLWFIGICFTLMMIGKIILLTDPKFYKNHPFLAFWLLMGGPSSGSSSGGFGGGFSGGGGGFGGGGASGGW